MNFLAHAYLSGNNEELLIGNFIADSVKGKDYQKYTMGVRHGIDIHRKIDAFTDSDSIVKKSKDRIRPVYGKYAPVIMDVFYDHFLAVNWHYYSKVPLEFFSNNVYQTIHKNLIGLPLQVQEMLPYMMHQNWLLNYSNLEGIERTLQGLSRRSKFNSKMELARKDLERDYELYQEDFQAFFPRLKDYVIDLLKIGSL